MAVLDFLLNGKKEVEILFFNHSTPTSNKAEAFLRRFCEKAGLTIHVGHLSAERPSGASQEEFWREQRYEFFDRFEDRPVITAHHLDDVIEFYIFSTTHGKEKITPYRRGNVIRPFLLTEKVELQEWCKRKKVPWVEDTSNKDNRFARNRIRNVILPELKKINPGLKKIVAKKVKWAYNNKNKG